MFKLIWKMKDSWCFNIISILISLKSSTSFHSVACFSLQILFELYFKSFQVVLPPTHQTSIKHPSCCIASIKSHKEYSNWPVLSDLTDVSFCVGFAAVNVAAVQVVNWDHPARPNVWQKLHPLPGEDFDQVETSISWVGGVAENHQVDGIKQVLSQLRDTQKRNQLLSSRSTSIDCRPLISSILQKKRSITAVATCPSAKFHRQKKPKRLRSLWWCNGRPFLGPWPLARSWGPEVC